jgi:hypothetical protein
MNPLLYVLILVEEIYFLSPVSMLPVKAVRRVLLQSLVCCYP